MLSLLGLSRTREQTSGSQQRDDVLIRRLEERLRTARVNLTSCFCTKQFSGKCVTPNGSICKPSRLVFQSRGESLQQEAAQEPASRLQNLRDRDTVTRFDREVRVHLSCVGTGFTDPAVEI